MSTCAATSSRLLSAAGLLLAGGCALVMDGTSQEVSFSSVPPGARFSVAGHEAETPATVDVPKVDFTIVFSKPGYHPRAFELKRQTSAWFYASLVMGVISASVDVLSGAWTEFQTDRVHVVLEPLPETKIEEREAELVSSPPGAEVRVGDVVQGRTPLTLRLGWGVLEEEKPLTFHLSGYRDKTTALKRGDPRVAVELEPVPVVVRVHFVSVPPGADVRLDGRGVGRTPLYADATWLPADPPKRVEFSRDGYRTETRTLAGPGQGRVEAELPEVFEEVPFRVSVFPPGSEIELDGAPVRLPPAGLPLRWSVSLRRHSLRVSHPGYRPETRDVPFAERNSPLDLRLRPLLPKSP